MSLDRTRATTKYKFNKDLLKYLDIEETPIDAKELDLIATHMFTKSEYMINKKLTDENKDQLIDIIKWEELVKCQPEYLNNLYYSLKFNFSEQQIKSYLYFIIDEQYHPKQTYFGTPVNTYILLDFIKKFDENNFNIRNDIMVKIKQIDDTTEAKEIAPMDLFNSWIKAKSKSVLFHLFEDQRLVLVPFDNFKDDKIININKIKLTDVVEGYLTELNFEKIDEITYKYNGELTNYKLVYELVSRGIEQNFKFTKYIIETYDNFNNN